MTGATLYAKREHSMWVVKVRHSGDDLREFLNTPLDWSKEPETILKEYLVYHRPSGYDLRATREFYVANIDHIWDNRNSPKENIDLFENCHYLRFDSGYESDYNCSYEDYVYILDFDNKGIIKIRSGFERGINTLFYISPLQIV